MSLPMYSVLATTAAVLSLTAAPATGQAPAAQAGVAAAVRGDVTLVAAAPRAAGRAVGRNLTSGDRIYLGDVIETGPQAGMQIMLMDETIFTIGPDAGLVIDTFVYNPRTSSGQVTATVLKGAFRFVSGRVAKDEPRNMNVKTPVGTIGIRGTSAAGRINPPDANGVITAQFVLLGPGGGNNANERAGRIIVTNANTSVEIARSGFGTTINGSDGIPTPPARIDPVLVGTLTGQLGTDGGARPGDGNARPPQAGGTGPGVPVRLARATALTGQNLGQGGTGAANQGRIGGRLNEANRQLLTAAEETANIVNTTIATFDQLRSVQSGTASFNFGTIALTHVSGPNANNSSGSYQATASIDFGARTLDLTISNVSYSFAGGQNQLFVFNPNAGDDINGGYDNDSGSVADTWTTSAQPDRFSTMPTDGSSAEVSAAILNSIDTQTIASHGRVSVTINNGTDVISGGKTVAAQ